MPLSDYTVEWEGENIPIQSAVLRIETGNFPASITISHPTYGTRVISTPGRFRYHYFAQQTAAERHVGPGFGLHRTYASGLMPSAYFNENGLLSYMYTEFPALEQEIQDFRSRVRGKTQRLQREGMRRMINREENRSGRHMPNELRQEAAEMLGENHPVRGAFTVKENFSKINTTLFQGGKKRRVGRKTKKQRKQRASRKH